MKFHVILPFKNFLTFCLTIICLNSISLSESKLSTNSNIDKIFGKNIPAAPRGFKDRDSVMQAFQNQKVALIDQNTEFPDVQMKRNIRYSDAAGSRGVLDLYTPRNEQKKQIGLILVHGGGWRAGSKEDYRYYGQQFAHRGFVSACINYRLVPEGRFPSQIQDVKCAIRWMRNNAEELNVDPNRIAIMGGSAGGHLSLLAAYANNIEEFEQVGGHADVNSNVQAVIDIYGPTDFSKDYAAEEDEMVPGLIKEFLGKAPDLVNKNKLIASPLYYLDEDDPPTLIIHGTIDQLVPVKQADRLSVKLNELKVTYVYDRLEGWPHAMDIAKPVNDRVLFLVENFLNHVFQTESDSAQETQSLN